MFKNLGSRGKGGQSSLRRKNGQKRTDRQGMLTTQEDTDPDLGSLSLWKSIKNWCRTLFRLAVAKPPKAPSYTLRGTVLSQGIQEPCPFHTGQMEAPSPISSWGGGGH